MKTRRINTIAVMANGHSLSVFKGNNHYYNNGYYYRNINNSYHLLPTLFGVQIVILPFCNTKIVFGTRPHY